MIRGAIVARWDGWTIKGLLLRIAVIHSMMLGCRHRAASRWWETTAVVIVTWRRDRTWRGVRCVMGCWLLLLLRIARRKCSLLLIRICTGTSRIPCTFDRQCTMIHILKIKFSSYGIICSTLLPKNSLVTHHACYHTTGYTYMQWTDISPRVLRKYVYPRGPLLSVHSQHQYCKNTNFKKTFYMGTVHENDDILWPTYKVKISNTYNKCVKWSISTMLPKLHTAALQFQCAEFQIELLKTTFIMHKC
jgi:hypothetical protein